MISVIPQTQLCTDEPIDDELVHRCLSLYKPDHVFIQDAHYSNLSLTASFRLYPLEFHRKPLHHLSRVQIVHYIGQAAYVLGGCLVRENLLTPLCLDDYVHQVETEACTFRQLRLQFRRYLPNADGTTIRLRCSEIRRAVRSWLLSLEFELNDGACFGGAHAVVMANAMSNAIESAF
jgi:hypothetical protein